MATFENELDISGFHLLSEENENLIVDDAQKCRTE